MNSLTAPGPRVKARCLTSPGTCSNCAGHGYVPTADGDISTCCVCAGLGRCLRVVRDDPPPVLARAPHVVYVATSVDWAVASAEGGRLIEFVEELQAV